METFDNYHYRVNGADVPCAFYYVDYDYNFGHGPFKVIGNLIKCHEHRTCLKSLKIQFKGIIIIIILLNGDVTDGNGNLHTLPVNLQNEIDITKDGKTIKAVLSNGVTVTVHRKKAVIEVLASYMYLVDGMYCDPHIY